MNTLSEAIILLRLFILTSSLSKLLLRTWIPHNLHLQSTHTLFQLSSCSWPPVNPTFFALCVCVCKKPTLLCLSSEASQWATTSCEKWLLFHFQSSGLPAVCLSVGLGVCPQASPLCVEEEDISAETEEWQPVLPNPELPAGRLNSTGTANRETSGLFDSGGQRVLSSSIGLVLWVLCGIPPFFFLFPCVSSSCSLQFFLLSGNGRRTWWESHLPC